MFIPYPSFSLIVFGLQKQFKTLQKQNSNPPIHSPSKNLKSKQTLSQLNGIARFYFNVDFIIL